MTLEGLRDYLISVISTAMVSALIMRLVHEKGTLGTITKLLCGLFVIYTAVKPIPAFDLSDLGMISSKYSVQAQQAGRMGEDMGRDALRQGIKDRTETYILDKAKVLKADLQVEVELSEDNVPVPEAVSIFGKVSPYAKEQLSEMIEAEIGIEMEYQKWN